MATQLDNIAFHGSHGNMIFSDQNICGNIAHDLKE